MLYLVKYICLFLKLNFFRCFFCFYFGEDKELGVTPYGFTIRCIDSDAVPESVIPTRRAKRIFKVKDVGISLFFVGLYRPSFGKVIFE